MTPPPSLHDDRSTDHAGPTPSGRNATRPDSKGKRTRSIPLRKLSGEPIFRQRLRSDGPLSKLECALAREAGLELAFDPVQSGWVLAHGLDDMAIATDGTSGAKGTADAARAVSSEILEAFTLRSAQALRDFDAGRTGEEALARDVWSLPESLLREHGQRLSGADRLRALRRLQTAAAEALRGRLGSARTRRMRRHESLLEGHDYVLRPWREQEAPQYRELLEDERIWRFLPEERPTPFDLETAESLIAIANELPHHEVRAIEHQGQAVGQIRMLFSSPHHATDPAHADAEISYWLGVDHWGGGIASHVIPLYTVLTFQKHDLHSIFARVDRDNVASIRALERAGFRDEGDLSEEIAGGGRIRTLRCYREDLLEDALSAPLETLGDRLSSDDATDATLQRANVPRKVAPRSRHTPRMGEA